MGMMMADDLDHLRWTRLALGTAIAPRDLHTHPTAACVATRQAHAGRIHRQAAGPSPKPSSDGSSAASIRPAS